MGCMRESGPPLPGQHTEDAITYLRPNLLPMSTTPVAVTKLKLDWILEVIADTEQDLSAKNDVVAVELGILQAHHWKLADRVTHTEQEIQALSTAVTILGE
ncbi:hypothetical protein NDU88_002090 [Pleurodeles waltl]|uniref:Uncharacterized protein n=1 Tax=Pleurodeles waltl TaxID=8319 RepID=A0AAV7P8G6_PLEWA|nr:hypothetical protein NDU88_002090 [Pleurodeles waltl]